MKTYKNFLLILIVLAGCQIVSVEGPMATDDQLIVDLGVGSLPNSSEIGLMLHNDSSKTWSASQFAIEGIVGFLNCRLDDTITLHKDGTYSYDGGNTLCGGEDNLRIREGNWGYDLDLELLIFEPGTEAESVVELVTLDENTITFRGVYESDIFGSFDIEGNYTTSR